MTQHGSIPDEVMWEEGMLLAPQHFQQLSIRTEEMLHYHVRAASPFHWGVRRMRSEVLPGGVFRVTELEAVMPDGLPVLHRGTEKEALEIDVRRLADEARPRPVTVWLTVPVRRPADEPFEGSLRRYEPLEATEVVDENTGQGKHPVRRLRPRVSLQAGPAPSGAYVSFPLARVTVADDKLAPTDYEPPRIGIAPGTFPYDDCRELARRIRRKAEVLARRGDDSERTETQVQALSAGLPQIEAVLDAPPGMHPFALYTAACALAGAVAGTARRTVPGPFPAYDHDELRATFAPVLAFCEQALERVSETHVGIPFAAEGEGFSLVLREEWLRGGLTVGVLAQGGATEGEAAEWLEECRIASASRMDSARDRRIAGAAREKVRDTGRLGFVPERGEVLFRIEADPDAVAAGEALVVVNPRDPSGRRRPRAMVLYTRSA
ncbi:type VI secretion system baseplate subunit TssK [Longimicrobium sp.]|uniref:type VI secretion system baseplate subunit TssK n=1 Tax=Longimicrobium sp. TaxID=2029185 RepID=UPI002B95D6CD|nr:type VI secretion system baseplate subunit TssK [Longimicrobium sp.]HSU13835.1 type VI secretion system baseplate subunit TssK [Longimicrobium sp.]